MTTLKAAFGKTQITPPINDVYPDFFFGIPTGVLDDLYVRVAALDADGSPALVIAVDTLGFGVAEIAVLEQTLSETTGLPVNRIWISGSHSHSAPILCPIDLYGGFGPYFTGLCSRATALAKTLLFQLTRVTLSFGEAECDFNVNRRVITPEGHCIMAPNPIGVVDKTVPILACHDESGELAGVFFSYCCHPTILLGPKLSGDYPGQAQLALEARHPKSTALFLPGVFGNVRPNLVDDSGRFRSGTPVDAMRCGSELADAVDRALKHREAVTVEHIRTHRIRRPLPLDAPPSPETLDAVVAQVTQFIQKQDGEKSQSWRFGQQLALRQWVQEVRSAQIEGNCPTSVDYTFLRWDIGEVCRIGFSGEFFLEYGLYAKKQLHPRKTFTIGYTQGCQTYVPTAQALAEGGYEPEAYRRWGQYAPFSASVEEAVKYAIEALVALG